MNLSYATTFRDLPTLAAGSPNGACEPPQVLVEFLSPSQLNAYEPPPGLVLAGDNHLVRGSVFVLGGPPGVGKSRATVALAGAGAMRSDWFGLPVHTPFRTLIVQNENGRYRLKQEFAQRDGLALEDYVRVTPPPPYGLCFHRAEFRDQLAAQIESFIRPWSSSTPEALPCGTIKPRSTSKPSTPSAG